MWKKLLAVVCIPVVLILALSVPYAVRSTAAKMPQEPSGYRTGYIIGSMIGMAITLLVIFFLGRWILRTLNDRKRPTA